MIGKRFDDWDVRLMTWAEDNRRRPFEWGKFDCLLAAAEAVRAITGKDYGKGWRGRYGTARGAMRVLRRGGYQDIAEAITATLGAPMDNRLFVQRGDVVLFERDLGPTCGVCLGEHSAIPDGSGLVFVSSYDAVMAWKV